MKKYVKFAVFLFVVSIMCLQVFADEPIRIYLRGNRLHLPEDPKVIEGTTMVPIRAISEGLGYQVDWVPEEKLIKIGHNDKTISLKIGEKKARDLKGETNLSVAPFISASGNTFVPIRFVASSFNLRVNWYNPKREIFINDYHWTKSYSDDKNFFAAKKDGKYGIIDDNGNFLVEPVYDVEFSEYYKDKFPYLHLGYFLILGNTDVVDGKTQVVQWTLYGKDVAKSKRRSYAYSYTDEKSRTLDRSDFNPDGFNTFQVFYNQFEILGHFREVDEEATKYSGTIFCKNLSSDPTFIDEFGNFHVFEGYKRILGENAELVRLEDKNGNIGYLSRGGHKAVPFIYEYGREFRYDHAVVEKTVGNGWKSGLVHFKGEEAIPCIYDDISYYNTKVVMAKKGDKYGVLDIKGNMIAPFEYEEFYFGGDGLLTAKKGGKFGLIDYDGKTVLDFQYDEPLHSWFRPYFLAKKDGKYGLIDKNFKTILPFEHDELELLNHIILAKKGNKAGAYFEDDFSIAVPFEYDTYHHKFDYEHFYSSNYFEVDGKKNFIADREDAKILEKNYDDIEAYSGYLLVKENGKWGVLLHRGQNETENRVVLESKYDDIRFGGSFAVFVKEAEGWKMHKLSGKNPSLEYYDDVSASRGDFIKVAKKSGNSLKWGMLNENDQLIVPYQFEAIGRAISASYKDVTSYNYD